MTIMLVWNTVDTMKKDAGLCLKEEDTIKLCLAGTSLQSKTEMAREHCIDEGSSAAEYGFNRILRGFEERRKQIPGKRTEEKPSKNPGLSGKLKPEQCPSFQEFEKAFQMSLGEEVCSMASLGWMNAYELETLETWDALLNTSNIESDLRNLTTVISEALLPLLDAPMNTKPELATCYKDAESNIMKKLFPGCSELKFESETEEYMRESLMSLATWVECFHSIFADACNEYVGDIGLDLDTCETTPSSRGFGLRSSPGPADWMKGVPGRMKINEMSIPGTHDSMAIFGGIYVRCQHLTLYSQLQKGVRFFDIRLGIKQTHKNFRPDEKKLGAYHGSAGFISFQNAYFKDNIMKVFYNYLNQYPSEAIIFRYRKETSKGTDNEFCAMFNQKVGSYSSRIWQWGNSNKNKGSDFPTMDEIRGKIVILPVNVNCFGFNFQKKELDNYSGGGHNPFKPGNAVTKMVEGKLFRKRKVNSITDFAQNQTIMNETMFQNVPASNVSTRNVFTNAWNIFAGGLGAIGEAVLETIYKPSNAYKNELTDALHYTMTSNDNDHLMFIWASAVVVHKLDPKGFAKDVNGHLKTALREKSWYHRTGILVFDFITKWNSDITKIIYRKNWIGIGTNVDEDFCTRSNPCSAGQGDCDNDNECKGLLECGSGNCWPTARFPGSPTVTTSSDCCEKPACVVFYEHNNYLGRSFAIRGDQWNIRGEWRGDRQWNDKISSLRTYSNSCKVTLYEHANFQGAKRTMTGIGNGQPFLNWNGANLWSDRVSSAKCEC